MGSRLNVGILAELRTTTAVGTGPTVVLRGGGASASEATGYMVRFLSASNIIRLSRFSNGQEQVLDSESVLIEDGDVFWVREEAEVGQIRATVWRAGEAEADGISLSGADANPLPAGWIGVGQRDANGVSDCLSVEIYELVTLLPLDPIAIHNPDTTSWRFWPNQPPNVEALVEGFVPPPPTNPEDMPIDSNLPNPGQPKFNNPAMEDDTVTINIGTPESIPPGFTLTGYWITGIGEGEHSQVVGVNEVDVLLRQNNGTGSPYTQTQLNQQWFCVRAIYNGEVLSGDPDDGSAVCNVFIAPPPTEPPEDAPEFDVTAPAAFEHRVEITAFPAGAHGVEIRGADGQETGTPASIEAGELRTTRTEGSPVYTEVSDPSETKSFFTAGFIDNPPAPREYGPFSIWKSATTSAAQPTDRPNDPGFPVVVCAHDFSYLPPSVHGETVPASGGGFVRAWYGSQSQHFRDKNNPEVGTGSVPASTAIVSHGPQAPHGKARIFRHRMPSGMGATGAATGQAGGGFGFFNAVAPNGSPDESVQFRAIYQAFWVLYEGHEWEGQRALQRAGYRMTTEHGGGRRTNIYHFFHQHNNLPAIDPRRPGDCETSSQSPVWEPGYNPMTRVSPTIRGIPGPLRESDGNPDGAPWGSLNGYGNWWTGSPSSGTAMTQWILGYSTNSATVSGARGPSCSCEVGRWHFWERIMDLGTPDQPNGRMTWYLDGVEQASVENVRMLSNTYVGENGQFPNQGYFREDIFDMYHPINGAVNVKVHNDYVCHADYYMSGIPF